FRPHSREFVCAGGGDIVVWNLAEKEVYSKKFQGSINQAVYSPNGRLLGLASGMGRGDVILCDAATGKELRVLTHSRKFIFPDVLCLGFSPDGKWLASGGTDLTVRVWQTATGKPVATLGGQTSLGGHTDAVLGVAFSLDGRQIASAGADGTVKIWDVQGSEPRLTLKGHTGKVRSVAFSPEGRRLASVSSDETRTRGQ